MRLRFLVALCAAFALSACAGGRDGLRNLDRGLTGPDEFSVLPARPLVIPATRDLPPPRPGAGNLADPDPVGGAIAALGGTAGAGGAGDAALIAAISRYGTDPAIRATLAREDAEFRRRAVALPGLAGDRYYQAYARQALDAQAELARFRAAGIAVPTAPPPP